MSELWKMLLERNWTTLCYEGAYHMAWYCHERGERPTLVHGMCLDNIPHAWVVVDDKVYDVTKSLFNSFPKDEWYAKFKAEEHARYTVDEAIMELGKDMTYGPW